MDVYIEDVFIDNFLIDFVILFVTSKVLRLDTKIWHISLCACVGVGLALLNMLFSLSGLPLFLYKFLCGALIVLCLVPKAKPLKYITTYTTFLFLTFLVGGACLAISFTFGQKTLITETGEISYNLSLPLGVVMAIVCLTSWLVVQLIRHLKQKLARTDFTFNAVITLNNKTVKTKAFLDTGNTLCDPHNFQPILFLCYKDFQKICNVPLTQILMRKNIAELPNCHYLSVNTVGNNSNKMLVFNVDKITLTQEKQSFVIKNAMVGLTFTNLQKNLDAGLLLNPKVLNGGYCEQIS